MAFYDQYELDPDQLPYSYPIQIDDKDYTLGFSFNPDSRQIIASISDDDGLIATDPIILDRILFGYCQSPRMPMISIIPRDESGQETEANLGNINKTVFLTDDDIDRGDVESGADAE